MGLRMNVISKVANWIFILCLPALLISAGIAWGFNSLWIYQYGFRKYNVSQTTGFSPAELDKIAKSMIHYFNSSDEYVQISISNGNNSFDLFTIEEQTHLNDVKQLVWLDYRILLIAFILVLVYTLISVFWHAGRHRRQLACSLVWGSGLCLGLILIIGIAGIIDFDWLWLQFHFLSFSNDFWSAPGYMIPLFAGVSSNAAIICIGFTAGLALILGGLSLVYLRQNREQLVIDKGKRSAIIM
jgi:uncharacterized membrane protein